MGQGSEKLPKDVREMLEILSTGPMYPVKKFIQSEAAQPDPAGRWLPQGMIPGRTEEFTDMGKVIHPPFDPKVERNMLLPSFTRKEGLLAPSIIADPLNATWQGMQGGDVDPRHAITIAGTAGLSGPLLGPVSRGGTVTTFGGVRAKTANMTMLREAKTLEKAGASRDEIWNATGWFKGTDKKWKFEIPDTKAQLVHKSLEELVAANPKTYGEIYNNPDVFAAYPWLKDIPAKLVDEGPFAKGASFAGSKELGKPRQLEFRIGKSTFENMADPVKAHKALTRGIHEGMHSIQLEENFARGSSPFEFLHGGAFGQMFPSQGNFMQALGKYRRTAGEVEARAAESRLGLNRQPATVPPWKSYDVPEADQLLRFNPPQIMEPFGQPQRMPRTPRNPQLPLFSRGEAPIPKKGPTSTVQASLDEKALSEAALEEILGRFPTTTPGRIISRTKEQKGYTVQPLTGEVPAEGIMVGRWPNTDPRILVTPSLQRNVLSSWAQKNKKLWTDPESFLGSWQNKEGKFFVEAPKRFLPDVEETIRPATKYGERTGQEAIYSIKGIKGEHEFPVGEWEKFVKGPQFKERMDLMATQGEQVLPKGTNWSQLEGTIFETLYGKENLKQASGVIGATSPNTSPRQNLKIASEYLRRMMAGEPLNQPNWRTPEGLMNFGPGKQLGMAQARGRPEAIEAAGRGDLAALGDIKVGNMARAPWDPNAAIFDRRWAWLAEDPKQGIFTSAKANVIDEAQYPLMKNIVTEDAISRGEHPRDYSARVWVGIGEFIKKHGNIFGEKRDPGRVGSNAALADEMMQLINDKAKFLGVSVETLISRISKGDANLMSWVLAAPAGISIYQAIRDEERLD